MAARWNSGASQFADKLGPVTATSSVIKSFGTYAGVAMGAAVLSRYGTRAILWLHVPYATSIGEVLAVVTLVSMLAALWTLGRWRRSRLLSKAQALLRPQQRALLGLPPTPPPKPAVTRPGAAATSRPASALLSPMTPAQPITPVSSQGRSYMDATPHSLLASAASTRSSLNSSPGGRLTPYSGTKAVATPQELRHYIDSFGRQPLSPLSPAEQNAGAGYGNSSYPTYYDQGQEAAAQSPALPLGRDAPTYRPSLLPRKVVASAGGMAATDTLQPGTDQDMRQMLAEVLGMGQQDMDTQEDEDQQEQQRRGLSGWGRLRGVVLSGAASSAGPRREPLADLALWTERLREWLGGKVLRPLVALLDGAHEEVARLLRAAGEAQQQLPPLWAAVEGGSGGNPGGGVDAEGLVRHLLGRCAALSGAQQEQLRPLIVALHRYDCLLSLLKGRRPPDLLPPTPPGYIANRVRSLAVGSCMQAFNWNGGGEHMGRAWGPELPTDSALVLYLFAAFVEAPGWDFPLQPMSDNRGTCLYLGQLPSRTPTQYSAILAYRPERPGPSVTALIGSNLASLEPRFSLLASSRAVTLNGRDGVFHAVLMFVQFHAARRHGLLGGHSISDPALGLDRVIAPGGEAATVPQRVFNWWFPPQR